jgi:hypothetical protein
MTHRFKASGNRTDRSCHAPGCGLIRGNEIHGHTCTGKMLLNAPDERTASCCYECGRTIPVGGLIRTNTALTKIGGGVVDFPDYC